MRYCRTRIIPVAKNNFDLVALLVQHLIACMFRCRDLTVLRHQNINNNNYAMFIATLTSEHYRTMSNYVERRFHFCFLSYNNIEIIIVILIILITWRHQGDHRC